MVKNIGMWVVTPDLDSGLRELYGWGIRKIVKLKGMVDSQGKKHCCPDTKELVQIWTHRDHDSMHKVCTSSSQPGPQYWDGKLDSLLALVKKLLTTDDCLQRKNQFSPMESHCIYNPNSQSTTCPAGDGQQKTNSLSALEVPCCVRVLPCLKTLSYIITLSFVFVLFICLLSLFLPYR